jgi:hypothetical protein
MEETMAKEVDRITHGILGDIDPVPSAREHQGGHVGLDDDEGNDQSMTGGSRHDRSNHAGSRDVTEGTTGGVGAEVGGTRNYRTGTGATGGDIGNRPE